MKKLKTIVVDDEKYSLEVLGNLITSYCPAVEVVEKFQDSRKALDFLLQNEVDLVFLDINMPFMSGIELLKKIPAPQFFTIFTTAFDQYAIDAIRLSASDYLLKPIDTSELIAAVDRVAIHSQKQEKEKIRLEPEYSAKRLVVHQLSNVVFIDHHEIIYLKADNNYTDIKMKTKKVTASKTIKHFENQLPVPPFYRCHQSYVVNLDYMREYSKPDQSIVMEDGTMIPLSKNKKEGLFKLLM